MGASGHNQTSPADPVMKMMMKFANDDDDDDDEDLDDDHVENGVPISVLSNFDHPSIPFDVRKMTQYGGNVQMFKCSNMFK